MAGVIEKQVSDLVDDVIRAEGFDLIRVAFHHRKLQVMAEPLDRTREMTIDDCARLSRAIAPILDERDPIKGGYRLEVSSPGLSRPLIRRDDYERFAGEAVKVVMRQPIDGRRRFRGRLLRLTEDGQVDLSTSYGLVSLDYAEIDSACLDAAEIVADRLAKRKADSKRKG